MISFELLPIHPIRKPPKIWKLAATTSMFPGILRSSNGLDIQFERNRPNPNTQTAGQDPEGAMLPYKLEQRRSALGAEQWVVVPNNDKEHVRPASQAEVSLWKNLQAAESEIRLLKNNLENARRMDFERGNRLRFEQRMSHGRGIKR